MPYQMNEGGFLSGGFVQDLYDRNQEYERMKQDNAAAESYWREYKAILEVDKLVRERKADLNLVAQAIPSGWVQESITDSNGKLTSHWVPPEKLAGKPTVMSTDGGLAVVGPDGTPKFYQSPWGSKGADTGGWNDPAAALSWAQNNGIENPKVSFEAGKYRVVPGQAMVDNEAAREAERQRQTAKQAALADITDAIRNGTEQEKADARASRRLMAQTGRVGMIETTPNEVPWSHPAIRGTGLRGYMGIGYPSQPAETGAFSMQPTVTTNWYDQVLGSAPTNGVPANLNITTPPATPSKTLDAGTARAYLQRAGGDKDKARAMARADGYTF